MNIVLENFNVPISKKGATFEDKCLFFTNIVSTHTEPELTVRTRFRVLNFYKGQSAHSSCSRGGGHIGKDKSKSCGFYQMQDYTVRNGIVPRARR